MISLTFQTNDAGEKINFSLGDMSQEYVEEIQRALVDRVVELHLVKSKCVNQEAPLREQIRSQYEACTEILKAISVGLHLPPMTINDSEANDH